MTAYDSPFEDRARKVLMDLAILSGEVAVVVTRDAWEAKYVRAPAPDPVQPIREAGW